MPTRAELKSKAKAQISGNIGILFLIFLIFGVMMGVISFIPIIGTIAIYLTMGPFLLGIYMIFLNLGKSIRPKVGDLFEGFRYFGKALALYLLIAIFTFLWSLLFVIPGIIKSISYSQSFYILANNPDMTALEALNESKKMMAGHKWEFFVLQLSFILWGLLVAITLGIAAIYVGPYMEATLANYYIAVSGNGEKVPDRVTVEQLRPAEPEAEPEEKSVDEDKTATKPTDKQDEETDETKE